MYRACINKATNDFEFIEVPEEKMYYRSLDRAIIEFTVENTDLTRTCFVHRGNPHPYVPQLDSWTVSDVETGLAVGYAETAEAAIEHAKKRISAPNALKHIVGSIIAFINKHGRANPYPNRPVIKEDTPIFWRDEDDKLKWARVLSKRDHLNPQNGVACVVTHHPADVVRLEDIRYVWPEREDLCPKD